MVESIYFLKPAWCGTHPAGLWPEQDLHSVTPATAFQAVVCHSDCAQNHSVKTAVFALHENGRLIEAKRGEHVGTVDGFEPLPASDGYLALFQMRDNGRK